MSIPVSANPSIHLTSELKYLEASFCALSSSSINHTILISQGSEPSGFYINVTYWLCIYRLHRMMIAINARRYSYSVWSRDSSHPRGTGDQSGGGSRQVWTASDVL